MRYALLIYDNENRPQKALESEFPDWMEYSRRLQEAGAMLGGEALEPTTTATTIHGKESGKHELTDGPYVETKEALGGFYLVDVPDLDAAIEWAKQLPHVKKGGIVEVRPIMEF